MPKPENIEPHKFKKGQTGNPNGRPKGLIASVNQQLEKEGFTPASKAEISTASMTIISLPFSKIKEIAAGQGDEYPFFYRLVAKELLGKRGMEMLDKVLDRGIGKVTQTLEHTGDAFENVTIEIIRK